MEVLSDILRHLIQVYKRWRNPPSSIRVVITPEMTDRAFEIIQDFEVQLEQYLRNYRTHIGGEARKLPMWMLERMLRHSRRRIKLDLPDEVFSIRIIKRITMNPSGRGLGYRAVSARVHVLNDNLANQLKLFYDYDNTDYAK
jgi:hypothetical protein